MSKKIRNAMPREMKNKCGAIIHTATAAAGAAGLIPIPVADTVPITGAQVAMIISLGKVFELTISESIAKSIIAAGLAQQTGRAIVSGAFKAIPGIGTVAGMAVGSVTAATLTETIGWLVADDFFKIYMNEMPEGILDGIDNLKTGALFDKSNLKKRH